MLQTILSTLTNILFFAAVPAFVVGTYQQHKFLEEWREDHAQSLGWFTDCLLRPSYRMIFRSDVVTVVVSSL
jgi:hypothetical protein